MESLGSEQIIHCAKPRKGLDAAMRALRTSEFGGRIADFIDAKGVSIKLSDEFIAPEAGAVFHRAQKEIHLPRGEAELDATMLAVSLAHEGYHAMQAIEEGTAACIEEEQDAYFAGFVAYTEMMRAGVRPLRTGGPYANDMKYMALYVRTGDVSPFERRIKQAYERQRERFFRSGNWLRPAGRVVAAISIRAFDFLFDWTEDFETLDRKQRHVAYWWDKRVVKRSREAHGRAVEWKRKWISEHRYDDFSGL